MENTGKDNHQFCYLSSWHHSSNSQYGFLLGNEVCRVACHKSEYPWNSAGDQKKLEQSSWSIHRLHQLGCKVQDKCISQQLQHNTNLSLSKYSTISSCPFQRQYYISTVQISIEESEKQIFGIIPKVMELIPTVMVCTALLPISKIVWKANVWLPTLRSHYSNALMYDNQRQTLHHLQAVGTIRHGETRNIFHVMNIYLEGFQNHP